MFLLSISIPFLLLHYGYCGMTATANVQLDNTATSIGNLTFYQDNENADVRITGTLTSLNASSSHVC